MQRVEAMEKTLMLEGIGGRKRRGQQRMRWLDGITDSRDMSLGDGQGGLACCNSWGRKESDTTERLNGTELKSHKSDFPGGTSGKEPTCQSKRHKRHRFYPWVRTIPWRRAWQPTLVFLPGEFLGQRSLAGYGPWGLKESDMTEVT